MSRFYTYKRIKFGDKYDRALDFSSKYLDSEISIYKLVNPLEDQNL